MEFPKQLELLMKATMTENELHNWIIYQDKSGAIVVKLRFVARDPVSHDGSRVKPAHFKQKSPGQVKRDQLRCHQWRAKQQQVTNEQQILSVVENDHINVNNSNDASEIDLNVGRTVIDKSDKSGNKVSGVETRSMSAARFSPIEITRSAKSPHESAIMSDLNPMAEHFSPTGQITDANKDMIHCDSPVTSDNDNDPECHEDSDILTVEHASDCSYKFDSVDSTYNCRFALCYYGGDQKINGVNMFNCRLCPGYDLCEECVTNGRHARHKDHLHVVNCDWNIE